MIAGRIRANNACNSAGSCENFEVEEMFHLVRKLLALNLQTYRRYVPAFAALLEEVKPAVDAIKLVERDVAVRKTR